MTSSASVPGSIFSMTVVMPRLATPSASRALAPVPDRRLTSMSWVSASLVPAATPAAAVPSAPSAPAVPPAWPLASCAFTPRSFRRLCGRFLGPLDEAHGDPLRDSPPAIGRIA